MRKAILQLAALAAFSWSAPAAAQVRSVDPDTGNAWHAGEQPPAETQQPTPAPEPMPQDGWTPIPQPGDAQAPSGSRLDTGTGPGQAAAPGFSNGPTAHENGRAVADDATPDSRRGEAEAATRAGQTVPRQDVFAAAEGVFGRGAEGLAGILEDILKNQGEPIAYISGREASGAFILGARWGSGIMRHRVEGDRPVYWTGPSIGFDVGGDASKVFILVYNLYDSQQLFRRYVGGEGRAYFVGGFTATYLRRGDVVLIPVRLGVGLRLGINAGYMRFTDHSRWLPF